MATMKFEYRCKASGLKAKATYEEKLGPDKATKVRAGLGTWHCGAVACAGKRCRVNRDRKEKQEEE